MICIDCKKYSTHKPWDNPDRQKRCASCYLKFCEVQSEEELDPNVVDSLQKPNNVI